MPSRDKYFGAVLVVAGAQCSRYVVGADHAVAKAIAFGLVLRRIVLQVCPQVVGKCEGGVGAGFQYVAHYRLIV